ncbi:MAG: hypothetical protein FJ271_22740 [Planctomycetes bacterium]|nr:hypothetical protein [Planctomycetota bacterium]
MNWLIEILGIEAPDNTVLQSAEIGMRSAFPWWLMVPIVAVLGAGVFWLYRRESDKVSPWRRAVLTALRTAALALLLLLLFRPVLLAEYVGERLRPIVVLVDNSQSMQLQDRRLTDDDKLRVAIAKGLIPVTTSFKDEKSRVPLPADTPKDPTRADLARAVLTHPELKLIDGLQKRGPVRAYLFGQRLRGDDADRREKGVGLPVEPERIEKTEKTEKAEIDRLLAAFKADESRTAAADAIREVLQGREGDPPAAIVMLTDGQDNASKYTLAEAAREVGRDKIPLHIYGVGTAEGGSLQLREVGAPPTIFYDDTIVVPLRWRAHGFKKGELEMTVTLGGRLVAKKNIPVQTGEDLRDALAFIPEKGKDAEQDLELVTTIQLKGNDTFKDKITQKVRLIDSRIKVLYVEGTPRFEYKFLQPMLLRDRRVDVSFLLTSADPQVLDSGPPFLPSFPATRDKFFEAKYNLIILGDVPAEFLTKERQEWIRDFVKDRGGLIVIAGRQNLPGGYAGTTLAEMLPIEFEAGKPALEERPQEYQPALTEAGKRAGMLALADTPEDSLKVWRDLPGFYWNSPAIRLRPGATSLLVNPKSKMAKADNQPMPVLASQHYGKGQVLFMSSDESWRWRYNTQDKHFARFWGQIIYQTGLPHLLGNHAQRAQMALERSQALVDRPGSVFVRLLDREFNPRKDKTVEAVLEWLDAPAGQEKKRKVALQAVPGREGEYRALLAHDRPGRFTLTVNNPDPEKFSYRVDLPPRHELEEAGMAEAALREAAALSGGGFYREEDLSRLADSVQTQKVRFQRHQEIVLWNSLAMILFVLLVSAEWLLRKFSDLV